MDSASLVRHGITYITAKAAAPAVGITADYITKLCRKGAVDALLVGNTWYVDQASVAAFVAHKETAKKDYAARNAQQIREATRRAEEIARAKVAETRAPKHPRPAHTNPAYAFCVATIILLVAMSVGTFALSTSNQQSQLLAAAAATLSAPLQQTIDSAALTVFDFFCPFFFACDVQTDLTSGPATLAPKHSAQPSQPTIVERVVERTETIIKTASAGISEQLLDARLTALEASFSGRIERLAYQGDRQAERLAESFADSIGGGGFDDIDITNSTFTGGSLANATLSGITFFGETDFASLAVDAATSTNATSTNLHVSSSFGFGSGTGLLRADNGTVSTLNNGSNGQVLKIVGGDLQWSTDLTGGGGGGESFFASTTDDLAIYPADPSHVVIIGDSATTTPGNILEVRGNSLLRGAATTYGLLTAPRLAATSSTASIFPYASTTALSATTLCFSSDCRSAWPTDTAFSTTSADYWKSVGNFFSTSSALHFASAGLAFSTSSNDYWQSQRSFFSTTSTDYWRSVSDLFSTTSAIYFAHSSTTIPKLYSSNIWSGSNSFSTLTLGSLNGPLHANAGAISATTSIGVLYGGTGLTTAPAYGQVLVGNSSGGYTLIATSSLGISGSGTATTMLSGLPDAITCTNGATTYVLLLTVNSSGAPQYHVPFSSVVSGQYRVNYTSAGAYSSHTNMAGFDCVTSAKSLATLYDDGQAFNLLGDGSLFTNADSTYLTATSKNLAIGTSTAYSKLSVWGASSGNIFEAVTSASTTAFSISATGNLGVGSTSPWKTLSIVGTMSVNGLTLNTGATSASLCLSSSNEVTRNTDNESCITSSARYKHDIQSLIGTTSLETLLALRPVSFEYNETPGVRYGLIAEEVDAIDPTLVGYDNQGKPNSVRYTSVIPLLIQAIQDLANITGQFNENLVAFLADATNGLERVFARELVAKRIEVEELCLSDVNGTSCYTRSQLDAVLSETAAAATTQSGHPTPSNDNALPAQDPDQEPTQIDGFATSSPSTSSGSEQPPHANWTQSEPENDESLTPSPQASDNNQIPSPTAQGEVPEFANGNSESPVSEAI